MLKFDKIYNENKAMVMRFLRTKIKNSSDIEELTDDIFIKVFNHLCDYDETKSNFNTWLINITKNTLIDYYRTKNGTQKAKAFANMINTDNSISEEIHMVYQVPDNGIKADSLHDSAIVVSNTDKAINSLKGVKKDIAIEFFYNDLQYEEIAEKLNLPLGTVKGNIFRIRETLQKSLKHELELV
jgi:RNA polymerase sigma-70 factor (ECF subfamily)